MEDLYKALGIFQQSVQNAAITKGISSATQQVDQINQAEGSALQKRQQQSQLANQLALHLSGLGADATQIQTALSTVAPPAIKDSKDAYQQALQTGDSELMKMSKDMQGFEAKAASDPTILSQNNQNAYDWMKTQYTTRAELEKAQMSAGRGMEKDDRKFLYNFQKDYSQAIESWNKQRQPLMNAVDLINNKSVMAVSAMGVLFARGSGNTGALTEKEQDVWKGAQDALSKWQRFGAREFKSRMTDTDAKALKNVAKWYQENGEVIVDDITDLYVNQASQAIPDRPLDEIGDYVTGGRWSKKKPKQASPSQQAAQQQQTAAQGVPSALAPNAPAVPKRDINKYFVNE